MRKLRFTRAILVLCTLLLGSTASSENPQTLRVDFYHSGNAESEIFSLDRVVLEPHPFSGNLGQSIDKTLRGKYVFEIVSPDSGNVIWSRSFSSIYGEWETTGEARKMNRTFHESVRFPNQEMSFAANSEWAGYVFIHEFGHHFAGLADEYYTSSVAYGAPDEIAEPYEPNVTALLDPDNLKWRHLVDAVTPVPTPWPKTEYEKHSLAYQARRVAMRENNVAETAMNKLFSDNQATVEDMFSDAPYADAVGAFEGALYQAEGYYRSEQNCIMFTRTSDFCRVCAAAIEDVIDEFTR